MYVVPWVIAESTTEEVEEKKEETGATTCSRATSVLQRDKLRTINDDRKRFYDSTG